MKFVVNRISKSSGVGSAFEGCNVTVNDNLHKICNDEYDNEGWATGEIDVGALGPTYCYGFTIGIIDDEGYTV